MNGKIIDPNFILNVDPDWSHGRNMGLTDEETQRVAEDTYWEMERFYEKYRPHKWPEEKPERTDDYLVNLPGRKNGERVVMYYSVRWGEWVFRDGNTLIKPPNEPGHWWELPEAVVK